MKSKSVDTLINKGKKMKRFLYFKQITKSFNAYGQSWWDFVSTLIIKSKLRSYGKDHGISSLLTTIESTIGKCVWSEIVKET